MVVSSLSLPAVLIIVLILWNNWRTGWSDRDFDSCSLNDREVVLGYGYGLADEIRPSFKQTQRGYEVRLEARSHGGTYPAIELRGEFRIDRYEGKDSVLDHDGNKISCNAEEIP